MKAESDEEQDVPESPVRARVNRLMSVAEDDEEHKEDQRGPGLDQL